MPGSPEGSWPLGKGAGICVHDNALSTELCESIIKFFEERPHFNHPGKTFSGVMPDIKNSMDAHVTGSNMYIQNDEERAFLSQADDSIFQSYKQVLAEYIRQYDTLLNDWKVREDTGYQYQRYTKNTGFYKPHIDGSPYSVNDGSRRVLASVMYLNTVEDGGGTRFEYFDYTCEAVVGRIVTFPTTFVHLHGGDIPRSSDKCIISTFVFAPAPEPESGGI